MIWEYCTFLVVDRIRRVDGDIIGFCVLFDFTAQRNQLIYYNNPYSYDSKSNHSSLKTIFNFILGNLNFETLIFFLLDTDNIIY